MISSIRPVKKNMMATRECLLDKLPEKLTIEIAHYEFRGRYSCRLVAVRNEFLTVAGLNANNRAFFLPIGSSVRIGFALLQGWGDLEGEVVGWSCAADGGKVMVKCAAYGRIFQRRRHPRLRRELPVSGISKEGESKLGKTRDLSETGLCIFFPLLLPEGSSLDFTLLPESVSALQLYGEVTWQARTVGEETGYLIGIQLESVSALQQARYHALLARLPRVKALTANRLGD